jgi:hypothetical protein
MSEPHWTDGYLYKGVAQSTGSAPSKASTQKDNLKRLPHKVRRALVWRAATVRTQWGRQGEEGMHIWGEVGKE